MKCWSGFPSRQGGGWTDCSKKPCLGCRMKPRRRIRGGVGVRLTEWITRFGRRASRADARRGGPPGSFWAIVFVTFVVACAVSLSLVAGASASAPSVAIAGVPEVGQTLTADTSGIDLASLGGTPPLTIHYYWESCFASSSGCLAVGQAQQYVVTGSDVGWFIKLTVTVTDAQSTYLVTFGQATATTGTVQAGPLASKPTVVTPVSFQGVTQAGNLLTFFDGTWAGTQPISLTASLAVCGACNPGLPQVRLPQFPPTIYMLGLEDVGARIAYWVSAQNAVGGGASSVVTPFIGVGAEARGLFTGGFRAEGDPVVGRVLSMPGGTWNVGSGLSFNYSWKRCSPQTAECVEVSAINQLSYTVTPQDAGHTLVLVAHVKNLWTTFDIDAPPLGPVPGSAGGSGGASGGSGATGAGPSPTTPPPRQPVGVKGVTRLGSAKADTLRGTAAADSINGRAGDDLLIGLAGNDLLIGGPGRDRIDAGPGNDTIRVRDGARDAVRCGAGTDTVIADSADLLVGCEKIMRK